MASQKQYEERRDKKFRERCDPMLEDGTLSQELYDEAQKLDKRDVPWIFEKNSRGKVTAVINCFKQSSGGPKVRTTLKKPKRRPRKP